MMRINTGIICALSMTLAFVVACADSGTGDDGMGDGDDMGGQTQANCGDGTCAASEVGTCTADCGTGGNGNNNGSGAVCGNGQCETTKGESVSTCPSDCNTPGNGSGSNNGSTTCPSDQTVCFLCLLDPTFCMGVDQATCQSCIGGLGSGSGFPMP